LNWAIIELVPEEEEEEEEEEVRLPLLRRPFMAEK